MDIYDWEILEPGQVTLGYSKKIGSTVDDGKTKICYQLCSIQLLERRLCYPSGDLFWINHKSNEKL
jgi:hypothetical protein